MNNGSIYKADDGTIQYHKDCFKDDGVTRNIPKREIYIVAV